MKSNPIITITILMLWWCNISAQTDLQKEDLKQTDTKIDSLLQIWNNTDSSALTKMNAISSLVNQYLYNNRDSAEKYVSLIAAYSLEHSLQKGIVRSHYFKGILFDLSGQLDSSLAYYNLAYDGYKSLKDTLQMSRALMNVAIIDYQQGSYQVAIDRTQSAIELCRKAFGDKHGELGNFYGLIGNIYSEQGYNQLALQNSLIALKSHEESKNNIRKADMLNQLGNIEYNLGNYGQVIQYNLEAIPIYQEYNDDYYQSQANADIGNAYIQLRQHGKAKPYLDQGLALAKQMSAKDIEGKIYAYQSKITSAQGNHNKALQLLDQSVNIHQEIGNPAEIAKTLEQIGSVYLKNNQPRRALSSFNQVINMADTVDIIDQLHSSLLYRAQAYEKLNRPTLALQDLKAYQELHDTLLNKTTIEQIEELRIIHNIENKEREITLQQSQITLLEKEATVSRLQKWLLGGGLGLSLGLFGLGYYGIRQKLKRNRLQHQHTLKEKELEIEKRKNVENELEFKKKELTAKALQLASKNEFLTTLEDEVAQLSSSVDASVTKSSARISRMIKNDGAEEDEWRQFSKEFTSVHQDFVDRLIAKHGTFTSGEMRLVSLLKMNLSSKEIANILRVSDEGIKKARYRLRKKMNLESSQDLSATILAV